MPSLRKFIVTEQVRASHAAKYFDYIENHHLDVMEEISSELKKAWHKDILSFEKKYTPNEHRLADLTLRKSEALTGIELDTRHITLNKNRFSKLTTTQLSIKYSLVYDSTDCQRIKNQLLQTAIDVFKNVLGKHAGIFGLARVESIKYLFSISHEDDVVKLHFKTTDTNKEQITKTIFLVGIEYGSLTGLRPFNRVFFSDVTK